MFDDKIMKVIGKILVAGLIIYVAFLLLDQQGQLSIQPIEKQAYVTAQVDSTITVRQLHPKSPNEVADSVHIPDFTPLKVKSDTDSLLRYNLYRHQQEIVTIDMEEHEEHVFFTWEDIKAYFQSLVEFIDKHKKK